MKLAKPKVNNSMMNWSQSTNALSFGGGQNNFTTIQEEPDEVIKPPKLDTNTSIFSSRNQARSKSSYDRIEQELKQKYEKSL